MSIRIQTQVGADIMETSKLMARAEDIVLRRPEVVQCFMFVGMGGSSSGNLNITLVPPKQAEAERRRAREHHCAAS